MAKKMTIDDLIEKLDVQADWDHRHANVHSAQGIEWAIVQIKADRQALEAGMQKDALPPIDELDRLKYLVCEDDAASIDRILSEFVEQAK